MSIYIKQVQACIKSEAASCACEHASILCALPCSCGTPGNGYEHLLCCIHNRPVNPFDLVMAAGHVPGIEAAVPFTVGSEGALSCCLRCLGHSCVHTCGITCNYSCNTNAAAPCK